VKNAYSFWNPLPTKANNFLGGNPFPLNTPIFGKPYMPNSEFMCGHYGVSSLNMILPLE
jgi:hypothetical protein